MISRSVAICSMAFLMSQAVFASDPKIASIGKYSVVESEVRFAAKQSGIENYDDLPIDSKKLIAQKLINEKILEAASKKEDLDEVQEVQFIMRSVLAAEYIKKHTNGDIEVMAKAKYEEAIHALADKKSYNIYHILVQNESDIQSIKKTIVAAGTNWKLEFKKVAQSHSEDKPTAQRGGLVGMIVETKLPNDFISHVRKSSKNTLIGPFKTSLGYHVAFFDKVENVKVEPYEKLRSAFISVVISEETERLAKEQVKGKEIQYNIK